MEVKDYSNKLAQARNDFNKTNEQLRKNQEKQAAHTDKVNEQNLENQSKVYIRESQEKDKVFGQEAERMRNEMAKELDKRQEQYRNQLKNETKEFQKDREATKANYQKRLGDMNQSFKSAIDENEYLSEAHKKALDNKSNMDRTSMRNELNQDVARVKDQSETSFNKFRAEQEVEKHKQNIAHSDEKRGILRENDSTRNKMVERNQLEAERTRRAQMQDIANLKEHQDSSIAALNETKAKDLQNIRKSFEEISNDITEKSKASNDQLVADTKNQIFESNDAHVKQMLNERRKNSVILKSGVEDKVEDEKQRLNESHSTQVNNFKNVISENNHKYQANAQKAQKGQQAELDKMQFNNSIKVKQQELDANKYRMDELSKTKTNYQAQMEQYQKAIKSSDIKAESDLIMEKQKSKVLLNSQRDALSHQMQEMQEKNIEMVNVLKEDLGKEKTEIIEESRRESFFEREKLKDHMNTTFAQKEASTNQQLDYKIKENQRLVEMYEQKIKQLDDTKNKEMNDLKINEFKRNKASEIAFKRTLKLKDQENQQEMQALRKQYEDRLLNEKLSHDEHSAKLANRYENELKQTRKDMNRQMELRVNEQALNNERLVSSMTTEREALVQQYEEKIQQLKLDNRKLEEKAVRLSQDKIQGNNLA